MTKATTRQVRNSALAGIVGSALTLLTGIGVQTIVQPASDVSDKLWSYPWTGDALVPVSVVYALLHVLVIIGIVGLGRSGVVGQTRWARRGINLAVAGTTMLLAGELASIAVRDARIEDANATIVGALFGLATVTSAIGFLLVGYATVKATRWQGWRRYTPLATGIATTALVGMAMTKALPTGVAVYGACLLATAIALYTQPHGAEVTSRASQAEPQHA